MKKTLLLWGLLSLSAAAPYAHADDKKYDLNDYRNYFGAGWMSGASDMLTYADNMGFRYVMYGGGMEKQPKAAGKYFYLESPEYATYKRVINLNKPPSAEDIAVLSKTCALRDASKPFPENLAIGWIFDRENHLDYKNFSVELDFQQQKVIDETVAKILKNVKELSAKNKDFKFGGYVWDVPQLEGDFWGFKKGQNWSKQVTLAFWTGKDSGSKHPDVVHDYPTYSLGRYAFFKKLREETLKVYPDAKFIIDPAFPWEHWQKGVEENIPEADRKSFVPDLITEEFSSTNFVEDPRLFKSGILDKSKMANSTFHLWYDFPQERKVVATAALNGAWTTFFGHMGVGCNYIRDVPARMKISRAIATWENLNNTPISARHWDGGTYESPTAYMSADAVAALQPGTQKLYFCFVTPNGKVNVPAGFKVDKIYALDGLFTPYKKPVQKGLIKVEDGVISPEVDFISNEGFVALLKPAK